MTDGAVRRLASGLLRQTAQDIHTHYDARAFLSSPYFSLICEALDVKEDWIRNELIRRTNKGKHGNRIRTDVSGANGSSRVDYTPAG